MRWVSTFFVVCVAVAAAALLDDVTVHSYDEEENNIGIFQPRTPVSGQPWDRSVRSFYYRYWLYPALAFAPSVDYAEPLTFQDVFEKPVFVVTPSQNVPNTFSLFYLQNGLRTLHIHNAFSWLREFIKHPGLKGLVFYPHLIYNVRFSNTPVSSVTLPDDFRMSDFVSIQECKKGVVPYMFIAPEDLFDRMHFDNIAKVSDFKVYKDAIEVQPVVALPRPVYESFYGLQPTHAQQEPDVVPMQHSGENNESGLTVNAMNVQANARQFIERPQARVEFDRFVVPQAVHGASRDVEHAGQYGYGQDQGIYGGQNVNYGQRRLGLNQVDESHMIDGAQRSADSFNRGVALGVQMGTEAEVNTAYGMSRNVNGAQSGAFGVKSASMSPYGTQLVQSQNRDQALADGQVNYFNSGNSNVRVAQGGISRVEGGSINSQLSRFEGTKLTGGHSLQLLAPDTGKVVGIDAGISQGHQGFSASSQVASQVSVPGKHSASGRVPNVESGSLPTEAGSLSKVISGSFSSGQPSITFPKEGGLEGFASTASQGSINTGVVSRTGVQSVGHVSESQELGHSQAQSSSASQQGGNNLVRSESINVVGQAGVQNVARSGLNSSPIAGVDEHGTLTFSGSSDQTGKLIQPGLGDGVGLSRNINSGLSTIVGGTNQNIDATSHGLGVDLLGHHQRESEQFQQSGSISSSNLVSKSVASSQNVESSTISGPIEVSNPVISSTQSLVTAGRTLTAA